jgi:hypothetical protein
MKKTLPILAAVALLFGFSSSAVALTINDAGVAGILEGQVASNTTNEATISNFILAMSANQVIAAPPVNGDVVNCSPDQGTCEYKTGVNNFNGSVSGGVQQTTNPTVLIAAALTSQYILAKYDGPNAGYVLFNTAAWLAAGNTSLPANGSTIWDPNGSGLSHYTYFGSTSVPDGGITISLLGSALVGLGLLRRRLGA